MVVRKPSRRDAGREIIEAHKRVIFESGKIDKGARFIIFIPKESNNAMKRDMISKYGGKQIAIHNEEVIASVDAIDELDKILRKTSHRLKKAVARDNISKMLHRKPCFFSKAFFLEAMFIAI